MGLDVEEMNWGQYWQGKNGEDVHEAVKAGRLVCPFVRGEGRKEGRGVKWKSLTLLCSSETGWDLGPFAAMLAPGHTSPPATKYKETIWD